MKLWQSDESCSNVRVCSIRRSSLPAACGALLALLVAGCWSATPPRGLLDAAVQGIQRLQARPGTNVRLRGELPADVVADVRRPQLHQLRGLPDGPQRHVDAPARGAAAATPATGGRRLGSKTNQTPMVGSVAWWSTNHVAYVQQVVDANTIVISEDHWGGDFDWRRIVRAGGGWPTGFIHLTDEAVKATALPTIAGTPKVDTPLSTISRRLEPGRRELRPTSGTQRRPDPGATGADVHPDRGPGGHDAGGPGGGVQVPATAPGRRSAGAGRGRRPGRMRRRRAADGDRAGEGRRRADGGRWHLAPAPTATTIMVRRRAAIPGATQPSVQLGADQLGTTVTAVLTAHRAGYLDAPASSAPTAPVAPGEARRHAPSRPWAPHRSWVGGCR